MSSFSSSNNDEHKNRSSSADTNTTIHWAIVGLGDVCAIKSGPAFYKCHGSTLSAVMRRTPGAAREWIENNASNLPPDVVQSIRAFDSVEQMMQEIMSDSDEFYLDAVYVAYKVGRNPDEQEHGRELKLEIEPGTYFEANDGALVTKIQEG